MLDLVKVIVVFVVVMGAFVGVQIPLQLCFQFTVGGFGSKNIRVLRLIGRCCDTAARTGKENGAGLQPADQQYNKEETCKDNQAAFPVPRCKCSRFLCFLGNTLCRFRGRFGGLFGGLRGFLRCTACRFAALAALAYSRFNRCFWKNWLRGLPERSAGLSCNAF